MLAPEGALNVHEKAWNAYPYCRTGKWKAYMKDDFLIKIETWHKPDMGNVENVHSLEPNTWKNVEVVHIDIADRSQIHSRDYKVEEDPAVYKSIKTGRGKLGPNWKKELAKRRDWPHMCAYKLVTVKFKWWGLQNKVESFIQKQEKRLFTVFHRQLFCWMDKWIELTMDDIRRMEEETKKELDEMILNGPVRGLTATDD
ncbi:phosphatidylinositol transfer protein alpha isoform-like [Cetorhinus maximus]